MSIDWESSRAMPHDLLHPGDLMGEHGGERLLEGIRRVMRRSRDRDLPFAGVLGADGDVLCSMI